MPIDPLTGAPLPYPEEQQAPPPELLAMLGGAMGGGGMAPPMGAPAPPAPPAPGPENPLDTIKQILEETLSPLDAEESAGVAKIMAIIADLIKKQAKESDAALGVSPAQKFMRRQAASG